MIRATMNVDILRRFLHYRKVERKRAEIELDARDLLQVESVGYPKAVRRQLSGRFARGASLWLYKLDDKVAGYGWTLTGTAIAPHFFPLGRGDEHLFDFFVFPEYRGRRINPSLVKHVLAKLALEANGRAFIEAAEWNTPQLNSLGRLPFHKLGHARKFFLFGRTVAVWKPGKPE